jgi:hypothetical protein
MALPVEPHHTEPLFSEILRFLWTKQVDGQPNKKEDLSQKPVLQQALKWVVWASLILMKSFKAFGRIFFRKSPNKQDATLMLTCPGYWLVFL